jgi:hypothetical protein
VCGKAEVVPNQFALVKQNQGMSMKYEGPHSLRAFEAGS